MFTHTKPYNTKGESEMGMNGCIRQQVPSPPPPTRSPMRPFGPGGRKGREGGSLRNKKSRTQTTNQTGGPRPDITPNTNTGLAWK